MCRTTVLYLPLNVYSRLHTAIKHPHWGFFSRLPGLVYPSCLVLWEYFICCLKPVQAKLMVRQPLGLCKCDKRDERRCLTLTLCVARNAQLLCTLLTYHLGKGLTRKSYLIPHSLQGEIQNHVCIQNRSVCIFPLYTSLCLLDLNFRTHTHCMRPPVSCLIFYSHSFSKQLLLFQYRCIENGICCTFDL